MPHARALAAAIAGADFSRAARLKDAPDRSVLQARLDVASVPLIFKTRAITSAWALVRSGIGRGAFDRERRAATWLLARRFPTPIVCAHLAGTSDGRRIETLVFQSLPGPTLLALIRDRDPLLDDAAAPLGALWARLLKARRYLADAKPSNVIVNQTEADPEGDAAGGAGDGEDDGDGSDGGPAGAPGESGARRCRVWIVDVGCLRRVPPMGAGRALVRMLRDLSLEPMGVGSPAPEKWVANVAAWTVYALVGAPPSQAFVGGIMSRVRAAVARHGNPTPRDVPR